MTVTELVPIPKPRFFGSEVNQAHWSTEHVHARRRVKHGDAHAPGARRARNPGPFGPSTQPPGPLQRGDAARTFRWWSCVQGNSGCLLEFRDGNELRSAGHDVLDLREIPLRGTSDEDLWALAQRQGRIVVSTDKGFGRKRSDEHHGILVVRLRRPNRLRIHERVIQAMERFDPDQWPGLLVVMRDVVLSVWQREE